MQVEPIKPDGPRVTLPALPPSLPCDGHSGGTGLASLVARASQRRWEKRQLLYIGHDPAGAFYRITKGIVAEFKGFADGRRQIVAIRTVGDICGYPTRKERYVSSPLKRSPRSRPARSGPSNSAPLLNATPSSPAR